MTALPSLPGYIGTFELGIKVLEGIGAPSAAAGSYVLVLHAILLLPVTLLGLAEKIRSVALDVVGSGGERTIEKQYTSARTLIERGEGFDALREMVEQHTKAISLLKGSDTAAMFDEQVRPLLGEVQQT